MMLSNRMTRVDADPDDVLPCLRQVGGSEQWRTARLLGKTGSHVAYKVETWSGECFHLRLGQATSTEHNQTEGLLIDRVYQILDQQNLMITPALKLASCGRIYQDQRSYLLTHWIDGLNGRLHAHRLGQSQGYRLGISAGLALAAVHSLAGPDSPSAWVQETTSRCRWLEKGLTRNVKRHQAVAAALDFVNHNRSIICSRPVCALYNNLAFDQMIMYRDIAAILINFSQWRYGDPLYDLAPVLTDISRISIPFATGLLDCYLSQQCNTRIMRIIVFYAALRTLEQLSRSSERQVPDQTALRVIERLAADTDCFGQVIPCWYPPKRLSGHGSSHLWLSS